MSDQSNLVAATQQLSDSALTMHLSSDEAVQALGVLADAIADLIKVYVGGHTTPIGALAAATASLMADPNYAHGLGDATLLQYKRITALIALNHAGPHAAPIAKQEAAIAEEVLDGSA